MNHFNQGPEIGAIIVMSIIGLIFIYYGICEFVKMWRKR